MTKQTVKRTLALAVAIALAGGGIAYGVADTAQSSASKAAMANKNGEDQGPTQVTETYIGGASRNQERAMSKEGLEAVRDIKLARAALNDGYSEDAKRLLGDAQNQLSKVKSQDKPVTVSTEVKVGDKPLHSDKRTVTPDLIPIVSELQVVEDYTAAPEKAKAVAKAQDHMAKGERAQAIQTLKEADVGLVATDVSMPLAETVASVDRTIKLIDSGKPYEANLEMKRISDALVRDTTILVQPTDKVAQTSQAPTSTPGQSAKTGAAPAKPEAQGAKTGG